MLFSTASRKLKDAATLCDSDVDSSARTLRYYVGLSFSEFAARYAMMARLNFASDAPQLTSHANVILQQRRCA